MVTRGTILVSIAFPIIAVGLFVIVVFAALQYESLTIQIYAIFALIAVFVFLFGVATGQRFASPLKQLLDKAERLSKGELESRVYLETKDEFAELAGAFNKIAEDLQKSHSSAEQAESVADLKIRARTQELEGTIDSLEQKVKGRAEELQRMINESEQLQTVVKSREGEITNLRKELNILKESTNKISSKIPKIKKV